MARYVETTLVAGLPMWDTFEASFFFAGGISAGVVLGLLFPSLWRSFRRKVSMRSYVNNRDFLESGNKLNKELLILKEDEEASGKISFQTLEYFVIARFFMQEKDYRQAILNYNRILLSPLVSKGETNRALFEISQAYLSLGIEIRAFETGFELLNRVPKHTQVFAFLLALCSKKNSARQLLSVLNVFKGDIDDPLRKKIAHALSKIGEHYLKEQNLIQALEFARNAVRWDGKSGRANLLLWETTSRQIWESREATAETAATIFHTDFEARLEIAKETCLSSAAGAQYLANLIVRVCRSLSGLDSNQLISFQKMLFQESEKDSKNHSPLFYGFLTLFSLEKNVLFEDQALLEVATKLFGNRGLISLLDSLKNDQFGALQLGLWTHFCTQCKNTVPYFHWECRSCGALESLQPGPSPDAENLPYVHSHWRTNPGHRH